MAARQKIVKNFWFYRAQELLGLALIFVTLFSTVSLLTYHPLDPAFNSVFDNIVVNKGGVLGSYLASFFLEFFGLSSAIFILFGFCWGVYYLKKQPPQFFALRFLSLLLSILFLSYFLSSFTTSYSWEFITYGGMVGFYLKYLFSNFSSGTFIAFLSLIFFLICFCFAHAISFAHSVKTLRKTLVYFAKKSFDYLTHLPAISRRLWIAGRLLLEKKFFKKRIKNIDSGYVKAKEKISKIDKGSIPVPKKLSNYDLPDINLLSDAKKQKTSISKDELATSAALLQSTLEDFGINGKILDVKPGPVVTLYEFEPAAGVKSSRIIGLSDDVARSMSATSARISVISGQNAIGIELPNETRETVFFKDLIKSKSFQQDDLKIPLALGKNIGGEEVLADLAKMPHLLVAGTTGSGKSVAINTMILSILYKLPPSDCKFVMVDPKMLELSVYDGIPHLLSPVVTEPKKAVQVLRWTVQEMENRYRLMSSLGVRNIIGYNEAIKQAKAANKTLTRTVQTGFDSESGKPVFEEVELDMQTLPYIVVIVDEMADLMLVAGKEIEGYIQRLAQMARAAGIHLVVATQRPSVDVITGVIKANFPTRISFHVTSKVDSRTILGEQGAEQLLGMGDMLYMFGGSKLTRVHGAFVDDKEVQAVVKYLKKQGAPEYVESIFEASEGDAGNYGGDYSGEGDSGKDELYDQAVNIVLKDQKVSTSYIQRQLRIGYNRAANIVEQMEEEGVISPAGPTGKREILVKN